MNNTKNEKVTRAVFHAIQSYNGQLPADRKLVPALEPQLVGSPRLDSLDIVNLMVIIEQQIEQDLGVSISLFDGQTAPGVEGFTTVEVLVDFLAGRIGFRDVQS